jgi:hypothetical protein
VPPIDVRSAAACRPLSTADSPLEILTMVRGHGPVILRNPVPW